MSSARILLSALMVNVFVVVFAPFSVNRSVVQLERSYGQSAVCGQHPRDQHLTSARRNPDQKSQNCVNQNHATMVIFI